MHKLGLIVPYRNRYEHLNQFKSHTKDYLDKLGLDYQIIIVEQDNASAFNRGMLCNIGFLESEKEGCDYVVFHDVDMLPLDVDYSYDNKPIHLASQNLPFDSYFGGITLFPSNDFNKINGFSNKYWGWGFEDDDLRYRSIKEGLDLKQINEYFIRDGRKTAVFNGYNAYASISNCINTSRDFSIEITLSIGDLILEHTQQVDDYVVLNIEGSDFKLKYTSFKRFYLEAFDSKHQMYSINSDITDLKNFNIKITYSARSKELKLEVNSKTAGKVTMNSSILNYSKVNTINIGGDHTNTNLFNGCIDKLEIKDRYGDALAKYDSTVTENYKITDLSGKGNHMTLNEVDLTSYDLDLFNYSFVPHRRDSILRKLDHKDLGFNNGRWSNDLTRWNQLRFTNEVLRGSHSNLVDGLSTCKFKLHNRSVKESITYLKVGI